MWSKIVKLIVLAVFARRVLYPVMLFLLFAWVLIGLPIATAIVEGYREAKGICVETSFKQCPQTSKKG